MSHSLVREGYGMSAIPLKDWLLYAFAAVSPFFMFAVFFGRDPMPFWVVVFLGMVIVVDVIRSGGRFWADRTLLYLLLWLTVYAIATYLVIERDQGVTVLGRPPADRALTTIVRLMYVMVAYGLFLNALADAPRRVFMNILKIQIIVGAILSMFGLLQYLSYTEFGSTALTYIEPTNETFGTRSPLLRLGGARFFRVASIFNEPSWFGFYLIPVTVKAFVMLASGVFVGSRRMQIALCILVVLVMILNLSMTALLSALIVALLFSARYLKRSMRKSLGIVLGIIVLGSLVLATPMGEPILGRFDRVAELRDPSTLDRLFRVYTSAQVFLENQLIGVGPGGYAYYYAALGGLDFTILASPLNIWLNVLTDVGIIGFIPFLLFLYHILKNARRSMRADPLVIIYFWSVVSYLLLLTTLDFWYGEMVWFEFALLSTVSAHAISRRMEGSR